MSPRLPHTLRVPTRTRPLLAILLGAGAMVLAFTLVTVQDHDSETLANWSQSKRTQFSVSWWLDHGYFSSFGLLVRPAPQPPGYRYYVSSTGAHLISGFLLEKVYSAVAGHPSWRLLAWHNQVCTLIVAALLGLLAFRLAQRAGLRPLHALVLALSVEIVHFTFPDNLALFFEMNGRPFFLLFAIVFLLIEERCTDRRMPAATLAQAAAAFLLVWMEYVAGAAFLTSFAVVTAVLQREQVPVRRIVFAVIAPALLAFSLFGVQRLLVRINHLPADGSTFLFRSGLDGSSLYYGDHLDIAMRRDPVRLNFPYNREYLFRWPWLFFAATAALVGLLVAAMRGRVATMMTVSLLSLLGSYLLYAAVFSQAIKIHPYLFDVLLFTPLILALFAAAPSVVESATDHRGVAVAIVFFLAVWVSMVQLRRYALQYPRGMKIACNATPALRPSSVGTGLQFSVGGTVR
jgi:hypothetical protein